MDKRIMDLFDYSGCLRRVDELLLEYERASYRLSGELKSSFGINISNKGYNNNRILDNVIKRIESEEEFTYISNKLEKIFETFCEIEKEYFRRCMLHRTVTDEQFSELMNISMMNMRKIKKSVVFKITEAFSMSVMKGEL